MSINSNVDQPAKVNNNINNINDNNMEIENLKKGCGIQLECNQCTGR